MQSLCQELESSFYDGTFPWKQLKQHDAASLLKLFIRELPHPLLTVEYLNAFIAVNSVYTIFLRRILFDIRRGAEILILGVLFCLCHDRVPHKEAAAAGSEPAGPFATRG